MKIEKSIVAMMGVALGLASCGSDSDEQTGGNDSSNIVRINAGVNSTKGNLTTENLTDFGISITNSESEDHTYANVQVTGSNSTTWTAGTTMYWRQNTDEVAIVAYSPYDADAGITLGTTDYAVSVTAEQEEADTSIDFLAWKDEHYVPKTDLVNGAVQIPLAHTLSRIDVDITFSTEYNTMTLEEIGGTGSEIVTAANPFDNVYISGTVLSGKCDFSQETITVTADEGETENVYLYEIADSYESPLDESGEMQADVTAKAHYQCLLVPQESEDFTVYMTIGEKTFKWESGGLELLGGKIYTVSLRIGGSVEQSVSVKSWGAGSDTDIEANM